MSPATKSTPPASCAVNRMVAFVHVANVDAAAAFYELLGFTVRADLKDGQGRFWAMLKAGDDVRASGGEPAAEIMLARASGPIDAAQQAVLFYMYTPNLSTLRQHLLTNGMRDGGVYSGGAGPNDGGHSVAFAIAHPPYMEAGEMRVVDRDGYVILVGQLA